MLQRVKRIRELGMQPIDFVIMQTYYSSFIVFLLMFHVAMAKSASGLSLISDGFEELAT